MKPVLFFDTETSGLPLFEQPSEDPRQPHIVQLAACLVDLETRNTLASMDVVVRPDGWTIPDEVSAIHGITTERATEIGIPEAMALKMFEELWAGRQTIAHNRTFDVRIIRIAMKRFTDMAEADREVAPSDVWKAHTGECTQLLSTPILKLPPTAKMIKAGFRKNKSANLGEAFEFFTGKPLEGAHSAMVDVQACMRVYFAILDGQRERAAA